MTSIYNTNGEVSALFPSFTRDFKHPRARSVVVKKQPINMVSNFVRHEYCLVVVWFEVVGMQCQSC